MCCSALRKELTFGDDHAFLCVYVGRISNEKRLDVILSAVSELNEEAEAKQLPRTYLAIIGDAFLFTVMGWLVSCLELTQWFFLLSVAGDGPTAAFYANLHGVENRIYCRPKFLSHQELAEVSFVFGFSAP